MSALGRLQPTIHLLEYGYTSTPDGAILVDLNKAKTPCPAGFDLRHGSLTIFAHDDAHTCKACLEALPHSASSYKTGLLVI